MIVNFRLPLNQPNFGNAISVKLSYKTILRDILCPIVGADNNPNRADIGGSWNCRPCDDTEFVFLGELVDGSLSALRPKPKVPWVILTVVAEVVNYQSLVLCELGRCVTGLSRRWCCRGDRCR